MTVSVLVPVGGTACDWRDRARRWIVERYRRLHPTFELIEGRADIPWSKGAAVADAFDRSNGTVLVVADADSYVDPAALLDAIAAVTAGKTAWAVPHGQVYRLRVDETERVYQGLRPRLGRVVRSPYLGPAGGGIVVLTRAAYLTVDGIDRRFEGWGGEDLSFGWALETLCGPYHRSGGDLVHLWHPHPAPNLRGSPASEVLVSKYNAAWGLRRRMEAVIAGAEYTPAELAPVTFRVKSSNRTSVKFGGQRARFDENHRHTTTDPDVIDALRSHPLVQEVTR